MMMRKMEDVKMEDVQIELLRDEKHSF